MLNLIAKQSCKCHWAFLSMNFDKKEIKKSQCYMLIFDPPIRLVKLVPVHMVVPLHSQFISF